MSLEDKFYPEDGSLLTTFDNSMIKLAGKVGEAYQHITGKSYKKLVKGSYGASTAGFGLSLTGAHVAALIWMVPCYWGFKFPSYETPLEEEMRYESQGGHRKLGKGVRLMNMAAAGFMTYIAFSGFLDTAEEASAVWEYYCLTAKLLATAFYPLAFSEYLIKSDVPKPPKKTVVDKIKEALSSSGPEPVPAN